MRILPKDNKQSLLNSYVFLFFYIPRNDPSPSLPLSNRPMMASLVRNNPMLAAQQHQQRLSVAYNNLGGILKLQGRVPEAIACYEHVANLQPESPEAHANLASAYKDAGRHDNAIVSYRRAMTIRADFPEAFANLVHSLQCVCDWTERPALFARLENEVRRDVL